MISKEKIKEVYELMNLNQYNNIEEVLVAGGYVDEKDLIEILQEFSGVPRFDFKEIKLDNKLKKIFLEKF